MDARWVSLIHAMYDAALDADVLEDVSRQGADNAPSSTGSAYQGGFYGQVWTDLAMLLGDEVKSPTDRTYCGADDLSGGSLEACAEVLWASLQTTGDTLAEDQGSGEPSDWSADAQGERILFLPNAALSMHWVNRPATQSLATFGDPAPPAAQTDDPDLAATGGGAGSILLALLLIAAATVTRRGGRNGPGPRRVPTRPAPASRRGE